MWGAMGKLYSCIVPQGVRPFVKANPPISTKARDLITMVRQRVQWLCVCVWRTWDSRSLKFQGISNSSFANPVTRRSPHHQNVPIKAQNHTTSKVLALELKLIWWFKSIELWKYVKNHCIMYLDTWSFLEAKMTSGQIAKKNERLVLFLNSSKLKFFLAKSKQKKLSKFIFLS